MKVLFFKEKRKNKRGYMLKKERRVEENFIRKGNEQKSIRSIETKKHYFWGMRLL